jgi:hypothetical protein
MVNLDVNSPKCQAARAHVAGSILSAQEMARTVDGKIIGFSTNGIFFNVCVQYYGPAASGAVDQPADDSMRGPVVSADPFSTRLSVRSRELLCREPLAMVPFHQLGREVFQLTGHGDFLSLAPAVRWRIGDIVLAFAGVDPFRPGKHTTFDLTLPLAGSGYVCPADYANSHLWLIASLVATDIRFSCASDPGVTTAWTVTKSSLMANRMAVLNELADACKKVFSPFFSPFGSSLNFTMRFFVLRL